jgi:hypothetical protein
MANARKIIFDGTTIIPTPGAMEIAPENQDGGGDKVGAGCRNASGWTIKFDFVPGATMAGTTNPTLDEIEAKRTQTYNLPDDDANTASAADESCGTGETLIELEQATISIDSADGDGAVVCKCTIKGNPKATWMTALTTSTLS